MGTVNVLSGGPLNHEPRIVLFELDGAICESFEDTSGPPFKPCSPARIRDTNDKEIVIQKGALEVRSCFSFHVIHFDCT